MNTLLYKSTIFPLLLAVLLVATFGGAFTAHMMQEGAMHDCPYMGSPTLCTMSPLTHLAQWQEMFAATLTYASAALVLLFVLALFWNFLEVSVLRLAGPPLRYVEIRAKAHDPLRLQFARGILHSKAY